MRRHEVLRPSRFQSTSPAPSQPLPLEVRPQPTAFASTNRPRAGLRQGTAEASGDGISLNEKSSMWPLATTSSVRPSLSASTPLRPEPELACSPPPSAPPHGSRPGTAPLPGSRRRRVRLQIEVRDEQVEDRHRRPDRPPPPPCRPACGRPRHRRRSRWRRRHRSRSSRVGRVAGEEEVLDRIVGDKHIERPAPVEVGDHGSPSPLPSGTSKPAPFVRSMNRPSPSPLVEGIRRGGKLDREARPRPAVHVTHIFVPSRSPRRRGSWWSTGRPPRPRRGRHPDARGSGPLRHCPRGRRSPRERPVAVVQEQGVRTGVVPDIEVGNPS